MRRKTPDCTRGTLVNIGFQILSASGRQTPVVILDEGGSASATSQAILDVRTLDLEYITRDGVKPRRAN